MMKPESFADMKGSLLSNTQHRWGELGPADHL